MAMAIFTNVVETETWLKLRDRDFIIKNSETRDLKFKTKTSKFVHFSEIFGNNVIIISKLNLFQISGIFPTCFGCFLPANTTKEKLVEL